jgi:hypothetical protein
MPSEDETRRELFDLLEAGIGSRGAALLMTYLPPTGWTDLATRQDLNALRAELKGEIAEVRGEVRELRGELRSQLPKLITANIASMIAIVGMVLAAMALAS